MIKSFIKLFLAFYSICFYGQLALSNQALIEAIREKDIAKIHELLDVVDPNSTSQYGLTALRVAAFHCYAEGMEVLLNAGADPNSKNIHGSTPLIASSTKGCTKGVELLLNRGGIDPENAALMSAALNGHTPVVELLLEAGGDPNSTNDYNNTPLIMAAINNRTEIMNHFLIRNSDPNFVNSVNGKGTTAFLMTVSNCEIEGMELLLRYGADIRIVNEDGENSLLIAAKRGCVEAIRRLLDLGIDVDFADKDGRTPLITAVDARIKAIEAQELLEIKRSLGSFHEEIADINTEIYLEVIELLLESGANPDVTEEYDFTALMSAAVENDIEVVRLLLAYGADPTPTNSLGYSALLYANLNNDEEIVQLINDAINAMQK